MVITEDNELLFSVLFERDFLPQDAEALLGFKPNNGRHVCVSDTCVSNHYMGTQSIDDITYYLRQINADYPEIIFDEPLLVYLGVEYYDENDFAMVFEFSVCGVCYVTDGENLKDNEVRKMVDDLVFEKYECKL